MSAEAEDDICPHFSKLLELSKKSDFQMRPIDIFWIDPEFKGNNYII